MASMPCSETMKPSSMPLGTPKTHFPEFCKGLFKVGDKVVGPFGLNYDVIDVGLNGSPNEVPEAVEHTVLVSCPGVLQTKRH